MSHGEQAPAGPTPEPGPWPPLLSCAQGRAGASLQEAIDCSSCEFARVLKPGGRLIILDSLQRAVLSASWTDLFLSRYQSSPPSETQLPGPSQTTRNGPADLVTIL